MSLPADLARDVAIVRAALRTAPAGPDMVAARGAHERLVMALERSQRLRAAVLALGVKVRAYVEYGDGTEDLLAATCDAEELAT